MEEAGELANYLPLSFKTPKEHEYIEFPWDALETNHTHAARTACPNTEALLNAIVMCLVGR